MLGKLMHCGCRGKVKQQGAEFQDREYGKGMRVFNAVEKEGKMKGWRCTVCGAVKGE
jgi:hypothetical protein